VEGSIIVNVGEALSHLTGGYLKPTIHRVVKPPQDQVNNRSVHIAQIPNGYVLLINLT